MQSRKFFSETVSITGGTAISLADVLKAAGWGFIVGTDNAITTTPSLDSFMADQWFVVPVTETLYVGHDSYVRATAGAGPPRTYQGTPVDAGSSDNVVQPIRGINDAHAIWLFSTNTQDVSITFAGI